MLGVPAEQRADIPVSVIAAASAIARPGAHERQRGRGVEHARERGGGDLSDAVTGDGTGAELGDVTERGGGEETGGDQERLRDSRVPDLVPRLPGCRSGQGRARWRPTTRRGGRRHGEIEPRGQEARRLSALAGSDEYERSSHSLLWTATAARGDGTKNTKGIASPDKSLGLRIPIGQTPQDQRDPQCERRSCIPKATNR